SAWLETPSGWPMRSIGTPSNSLSFDDDVAFELVASLELELVSASEPSGFESAGPRRNSRRSVLCMFRVEFDLLGLEVMVKLTQFLALVLSLPAEAAVA